MFGTSLEFAPGTTEACEKFVVRLLEPADVLYQYREARRRFRTGDLVLVTYEYDPSMLEVTTRANYVAKLRRGLKSVDRLPELRGILHQSAAAVVSVPADSDAFWLVITRRTDRPVMVVLYATAFATDADAREPTILH
jgi:hypothetical protein